MCIVAAKYFPKVGWVGVKNRDRNYIPELSFQREDIDGLERLLYRDDVTQYREGLNDDGVCIIGASLLVVDDEKEIKEPNRSHNKDGARISKALRCSNVSDATKSLIKSKLTGNTLIFDKNTLVVLEASNRDDKDGKKEYVFNLRTVPKDQTIVRTNHGVELPWAGYQMGESEGQKISRKSSESRMKLAEEALKGAKSPQAMIDLLCKKYTSDPQMNPLRMSSDTKKMRTTSQILLIPAERTMYVRPIQSSISYNFWKMDDPRADTWVEILSNRPLWQDHPRQDKSYNRGLKHNS